MWLQKLAQLPERLFGSGTPAAIQEPKSFAPSEPTPEPQIIVLADKIKKPKTPSKDDALIASLAYADESAAREALRHSDIDVRIAARNRLATIQWSFAKDSKAPKEE